MAYLVIIFSVIVTWVVGSITNSDCNPEQIHIARGEQPNDITITWSTMNETDDTTVIYADKIDGEKQATGESKLFIDGGPLKKQQWIHNVRLKNLNHNSSYGVTYADSVEAADALMFQYPNDIKEMSISYRRDADAAELYKIKTACGTSDPFIFTTPEGGDNQLVRALVYGDMGLSGDYSLDSIFDEIDNNYYDMIIHNGDFAYNMESDNGEVGNKFMNKIQKVAARIPYMTSPGNHEASYNFSNYKNRFSMPGNTESMHYSYNLGPVHFVAINTEVYYGSGGSAKDQLVTHYNWMKADLEEANKKENREKHPWIIVYGHRPMYCSDSTPGDGCRVSGGTKDAKYPLRVGIKEFGGLGAEFLLKEYGVDLVIWAHEHSYERTWPLYDEKVYNGSYDQPYVNPGAPVHITTGAAGNGEGQDRFYSPAFGWSALRSSDYGYARLFVYNRTHLYMEEMSTQDVDNKSSSPLKAKKIDEFWLIKDEHKPYDI